MNLNLSDKGSAAGIKAKTDQQHTFLESRKGVWDKIKPEDRLKWAKNAKDPVMNNAYNEYLKLKEFFGDL